jgi:hypothetical protein
MPPRRAPPAAFALGQHGGQDHLSLKVANGDEHFVAALAQLHVATSYKGHGDAHAGNRRFPAPLSPAKPR